MKSFKLLSIAIVLTLNLLTPSNAEDNSNTFDIMYVYTSAARVRAGGTQNIISKIHQSVSRINNSFINSHMNIKVNLVHTEEISYPLDIWEWKGDAIMQARFRAAHRHILGKNDGYMDIVHSLRDKYSADMVQLIISNAAFGGLGITMRNNTHAAEHTAFTVVGIKHFLGSSVHELGHIMGNQHDIYNTSSDGTYSYSHGYGSPSNTFRTIMSYGNACNGVQNDTCQHAGINYWSSPSQYYKGELLGASYANARQTILNNAHTIANFRERPVTTAPTLTTFIPTETFENSILIAISGTPQYEVYINGVSKSILNAQGKAIINLENLTLGKNNFYIQLKDTISGTLSTVLTLNVTRKDSTSILIPVYYLLLN